MAFPPPPGFYNTMASLLHLRQQQQQFVSPMGGLVPNIPVGLGLLPSPVGITVPTGVASITAAPVRKVHQPQPLNPGPTNGQTEAVPKKPLGPPVTVFVGKISEKAPDSLLRQMLTKCGFINVWKRVDGADGKLQPFGFCEFADPESATTAIRVLNGFDLCGSQLNVKADAKADKILEEYLKNRKTSDKNDDKNGSGDQREDGDMVKKDTEIRKQLLELLKSQDLLSSGDKRTKASDAKNPELDDMELEEEKRVIINREIDKFRDTYKEDESEKDSRRDSDRRDRNRRQDRSPDRLRDRNRRREPNRDQRRSESQRYRDDDRRRNDGPSREDFDDNEEAAEKRRIERQLKDKEMSYQNRLRTWEAREDRNERDLRDFIRKERERKEEEVREAKKLKIFLEDYDDDRDDAKFYRSTSFKERLRDRRREMEDDDRDRRNELRELEELKRKLEDEGHPDPESEAEKRMNPSVPPAASPPEPLNHLNGVKRAAMDDRIKELVGDTSSDDKVQEETRISLNPFSLQKKRDFSQSPEGKRRHVPDIFSSQDDDEQSSSKKRRLPTLQDDDDDNSNSQRSVSSEEKKRQIKDLINQIPTSKEELFAVDIDWSFVDAALMDKRIKPWINKKIAEFIGEEEPALVEFICKKLNTKCSAERILSEVVEVLDEEAEVFVVKLWRLLIFETKAKQQGLAKW